MDDAYFLNSNRILTRDDILYKQLSIGSLLWNKCYIGDNVENLINKKKEKCTAEKLINIKFDPFCFEGTKNSGKYLFLVDLTKIESPINLEDEMIRDYLLGREIYTEYAYSGRKIVDTITGWDCNSRGYYMITSGRRKLTPKKLFDWGFYDTKERIASIYLKEI